MPNKLFLNTYDRFYEAQTDAAMVIPFQQREERVKQAREEAAEKLQQRRDERMQAILSASAKCKAEGRRFSDMVTGTVGGLTAVSMVRADWRSVAIGALLILAVIGWREVICK